MRVVVALGGSAPSPGRPRGFGIGDSDKGIAILVVPCSQR
jgi:hypothetical protein